MLTNNDKMRLSTLAFLLLFGAFFTSCIPTGNLIYLQKKGDAPTAPITPLVAKPYRLQPNDVLYLNIKAIDPELVAMFSPSSSGAPLSESEQGLYFQGFSVDDHGNIRIPILGEVNVLGFTVEEVREKIEKQLLETYFNKAANIFVIVKLAGFHFTINGEVSSPGSKVIFQDKVNILEAIANAGDILMTGDRKTVTVIRQQPQGTEMHEIDLTDLSVMQSPYFYLQPNDYVYIKPLKQKSWGTGKTGIESIQSIVMLLSLSTTVILLLRN